MNISGRFAPLWNGECADVRTMMRVTLQSKRIFLSRALTDLRDHTRIGAPIYMEISTTNWRAYYFTSASGC